MPLPTSAPGPLIRPTSPRRGRRRLIALVGGGAAAFVAGLAFGAAHESGATQAAKAFAGAWERQDYPAMYATLAASARERVPLRRFTRTYLDAAETLTLDRVRTQDAREGDEGDAEMEVALRTSTFGTLSGTLRVPVVDEDGEGLDWRPHHVFPGLAAGVELERTTELPTRGTLLTRDGKALARGDERTPEVDPVVAGVVGSVGPIPADEADDYARRGVPEDAQVGTTGLEREFDTRLTGTPGGELRAGGRLIAQAEPREAEPLRTTIDPAVQSAAVTALAGRLGGVAVLAPDTGEVLALAGVAYSAPQPPGSVFKIVTLAGALDAGVVKPRERFPVQTAATLSGVELQNANGESCGGTLEQSFAHSCNSVFAPLGAELGAERLVRYAEDFGFNEEPTLKGAAASSLPPAAELGDDLGVGSHAIGQGRMLATPVQMASVTATIANRGVRMRPTLLAEERDDAGRALPERWARLVGRYMRSVVKDGTGTAAAIDGVAVAGKTGTAELETTQGDGAEPPPGEEATTDDGADTTAWFTAFAPAGKPRVAVAVMLVGQGAGGATAAPAAREVLVSALKATR